MILQISQNSCTRSCLDNIPSNTVIVCVLHRADYTADMNILSITLNCHPFYWNKLLLRTLQWVYFSQQECSGIYTSFVFLMGSGLAFLCCPGDSTFTFISLSRAIESISVGGTTPCRFASNFSAVPVYAHTIFPTLHQFRLHPRSHLAILQHHSAHGQVPQERSCMRFARTLHLGSKCTPLV